MANLFKYLSFLILATMVLSCQNRPSEVLPRKKMERVMYDMYIAEAIIENDYQLYNLPENKEALIDQVLEKHKISEARWDTSLAWYSDNIEIYIQINDSVKSRLLRDQKIVEQLNLQLAAANKDDEIKSPDYIPTHFYLANLGSNRGFKFKLDSIQLTERFLDKDTIYFRFKTLGIYPMDIYSLKAMLRIEYSDTIIYKSSKLEENKSYCFSVSKQVKKDTIVALDGFINLSGKFPPIPIQLYQISLDNQGKNDSATLSNDSTTLSNDSTTLMNDSITLMNDSTILIDEVGSKKILLQPKK